MVTVQNEIYGTYVCYLLSNYKIYHLLSNYKIYHPLSNYKIYHLRWGPR